MKQLGMALFLFGCSEYSLNGKTNDLSSPEDEFDENEEHPPVALSNASVRVKRASFVQLDGTQSYDPDNNQEELMYSWQITQVPAGSEAFIDDINSKTPYLYADILGTYIVELHVTDSTGLESVYPSATMIEVISYEDLFIDLSWDISGTDLDIHLVAPSGAYYSDLDCFYGNPNPDWGLPNDRTDNPFLSMDDEGSEMREAIDYLQPLDGFYDVYVLYYRNLSSTYPYVTPHITIQGEGDVLVNIDGPRLTNEASVWYVGRLDWSTLGFQLSSNIYNHLDLGGLDYD